MESGSEPISDDELLYRRVPIVWYSNSKLDYQAFAPHKINDLTGLSMARARYKSIEQAAKGMLGKSYYVATLRAADLRGIGLEVVPRPKPDDPGHSELPDLNASNRKTDRTQMLQKELVKLCLQVDGPFPSPTGPPEPGEFPKPASPPATGDIVKRPDRRISLWAMILCVILLGFLLFVIGWLHVN